MQVLTDRVMSQKIDMQWMIVKQGAKKRLAYNAW